MVVRSFVHDFFPQSLAGGNPQSAVFIQFYAGHKLFILKNQLHLNEIRIQGNNIID